MLDSDAGARQDRAMVDAGLNDAIALYRQGKFAEAAARFGDVVRLAPDHAAALRLRGLALVRAGDVAAALPLLARARGLAPRDPLSHLHYGIGLQLAGRHAQAAALFRRATMLSPAEFAPWVNFSAALLSLGHGKAARAAARRAVALAPEAAEAFVALGLAHRAQGDFVGAREAFARAVRLNRNLPQPWVDYGVACYQLGDIGAAREAMEAALRAAPGYPAAVTNLAAFDVLRGDGETAVVSLRTLVEREPTYAPARLNLANALLLDEEPAGALAVLQGAVPEGRDGKHWRAQRAMALLLCGRSAEAQAELDAISPPYGDAEILVLWRRIALVRQAGDVAAADDLAVRMEALAHDPAAALLEHRIIGFFDLARLHHQRGRKDAAFACWQHGHDLLARLQPFSREGFAAFVDTSIARYDAARFARGPRADNADPAPVFIVGLPRSGTSLTEQILSAHAQVFGAGERGALHRLLHQLAGGAETAEATARAAELDTAALTAAADKYLAELHALAPGARYVVDKMPANARHIGFIATLLPGAKIVHCRRDPRDIGLSIFQIRFFGHHPYAHDLRDLGWTIGQQTRLMAHWRNTAPLPMIEIDLADWVRDFPGTLARLLAFLDLPDDPACARFYEQDRRVRTASSAQVREPINARGIGRWRAYERQLGPMFDELRRAGLLSE